MINISLLREYFFLEYRVLAPKMKIRFDLERIIDDIVFFCFFIGNDFLPALSALDIHEGSLDHLINFYKKCLPQMDDYIVKEGYISWNIAEPFIALLGKHEHQVFINRVRTLDQKYADSKNMVTFDEAMKSEMTLANGDKGMIIRNKIQKMIKQKKVDKCKSLLRKKQHQKYKKYLVLKKFAEDEEEGEAAEKEAENTDKFIARHAFVKKYTNLRN